MTELQGHIDNIEAKILKLVEQNSCDIINQFIDDINPKIIDIVIQKYEKEIFNLMLKSYKDVLGPDKYKKEIEKSILEFFQKEDTSRLRKLLKK